MNLSSTMTVALFLTGALMPIGGSEAGESLIPQDMVYVAHGPSVMGIDKEATASKKSTAYERRMNQPWSADALNDEGPAHYGVLGFISDRQVRSVQRAVWRLHAGEGPSGTGLLGRSPLEQT